MPATRKNASGYFVAPEMDAVDLFIGSEGTLGVICEVEVEVVAEAGRSAEWRRVFCRRSRRARVRCRRQSTRVDARALEFFDRESLNFLRQKYPNDTGRSCRRDIFRTGNDCSNRRVGAERVDDAVGPASRIC